MHVVEDKVRLQCSPISGNDVCFSNGIVCFPSKDNTVSPKTLPFSRQHIFILCDTIIIIKNNDTIH